MGKVNAWMGIGISNRYIPILKNLNRVVNKDKFISLTLILADEINIKYNQREKGQLSKDLFNIANKLHIEGVIINVEKWDYFSKNKEYLIFLYKYKDLFKNDPDFRKKVMNIVKLNRKKLEKSNEENSANYVLEELASINFMYKKGIVKIGIKNKEEIFDNLAIEYPLVKGLKTILF